MKETRFNIPTEVLQLISAELAYDYRVVPVRKNASEYTFITDSNDIEELQHELQIILGFMITLQLVETSVLNTQLATHYRLRKRNSTTTLAYSNDFLLNIIHEAKELGSSDIHFEPFEKQKRIRFRIDGKLISKYHVAFGEYPKIVNRIKIMGGMDISEKRLPQDGRITIETGDEDFDIRVSSLPTLHGEKLVLRILSKNNVAIQLNKLGLSNTDYQTYQKAIKKPNGIVLISGPTGSGKTTTLYATLKELNKDDTNILTIEDPIEYTLEGVSQVQLKESIGLDFASTLKTFLRQDPDIIMVGEIRDVTTANMAIRAALTGHLVLSTIHTNSAWGTISRLIDMGIPPFLIASTLNISVAQRLVRILCAECKQKQQLSTHENYLYTELQSIITEHHSAVGCEHCFHTGYKGRKAIYEMLPITHDIVGAIKNEALEITQYIDNNNIKTLKSNAVQLVNEGITSIDEVYSLLLT